jgi:formylglycine-generating enzyme required for sulfatase activity
METSGLDYPALASLNNAAAVEAWSEAGVPPEHRGVSRKWLCGFIEQLQLEINAPRDEAIKQAQYAAQHNEAGRWGRHDRPDLPIPDIPPYQFLDTHGFVAAIVKPLTERNRAPFYALVPEQFRGRPTAFVSHTWSSFLIGPPRQRIGSLDALNSFGADAGDEFIWIDFVCYNQHAVKDEAIAQDMLRLIEAIGKLSVCATPTPIYTRSWCLWELLSSQRTGAKVDLCVHPGYRNDKILAVNTLYRSFKGVGRAKSSAHHDQKWIYDGVVAFFGSEERANAEIEALIEDRFGSGWHELQSKAESIKFSPSPWIAGDAGVKPRAFEPYFEPGLLDATLFGRGMTVRESFADGGVHLGERETATDSKQRAVRSWDAMGQDRQEFLRAVQLGDAAAVRERLVQGTDPDAAVEQITPLTIAAADGHVAIVDMLLDAGAKIEGATSLSPLRLAADKGQSEVVRLLLRRGAKVDVADSDGWTALMWASRGGHLAIVEALLASGADINRTIIDKGANALHLAAQNGHLPVVRALIARGAAVDAVEARGATPLHLAVNRGHPEVVQFLLDHGADQNARLNSGTTTRELAENGNPLVVKILERASFAQVLRQAEERRRPQAISGEVGLPGSSGVRLLAPGAGRTERFKDFDAGPEMVVVPAGSFRMGSFGSEEGRTLAEGPPHEVRFAKPFAVGCFAVTFDEWDACVADSGCDNYQPKDQGWGRGNRPVINVSWNDAKAYVAWLSKKTGKPYRLLSEAEWEYVARAGTTTAFWWGNSISTSQANYNGNSSYERSAKGEFRQRTVPVNSFEPNGWGLYQVHGNVWEWTEDCFNHNYNNAPADGSAWATGDISHRAVRGGSWNDAPVGLRSAYRFGFTTDDRNGDLGFRVARTLVAP